MDGKVLRQYIKIWDYTNNGNWSDAAEYALNNHFDAYRLIDCFEHFEFNGAEYLSMRDIAILSMYIEHKRNEKENRGMNK